MKEKKSAAKTLEEITDFDSLYDRSRACQSNVTWKPQVKHFILNDTDICLGMEDRLRNGAWRHAKPRQVLITYPKPRKGLCIPFTDRVYQRALNDLALYPEITRSFILDNCACQKGKGPDYARTRLRKHIWNHFYHHGLSGWLVLIDVHGYYDNMSHEHVSRTFAKHLTPEIHAAAMSVLAAQNLASTQGRPDDGKGYSPGSQMVQIAGIAALNDLDHYIKERLHCRHYVRYMDDLWILVPTYDEAVSVLAEIDAQLRAIGFEPHPKKTQIRPLGKPFNFLGFQYTVTRTGKVYMHIKPEAVKHERKKMRRMAALVMRGERPVAKLYECLNAWCEYASRGHSQGMLARLNQFVQQLLWSTDDESHQSHADPCRTGGGGRTSRGDRAEPRRSDLYRRYGWRRSSRRRRPGATR